MLTATGVNARAGLAFGQGTPVGAAFDIAKNTTNNRQATAAGRMFLPAGTSPPVPDPLKAARDQMTALQAAQKDDPSGRDGTPKWLQTAVLNPLYWVLGGGFPKTTGDYVEANTRYYGTASSSESAGKSFSRALAGLQIAPLWDPEYRDAYGKVIRAGSSPMQTLWLGTKGAYENKSEADKYDLLDNPDKQLEREEYFSSGGAHWITGIGDAGFSFFGDPTVAGGKAISVARASRLVFTPAELTAARAAREAGTIGETIRVRRINKTYDRVVHTSEQARSAPVTARGVSARMASSPFFQQTADAGAIPYFMHAIDAETDDVVRKAMKYDALYAGAGDRNALARIEAKNKSLALELKEMNGPNRDSAVAGILARRDYPHLENLRAVDADGFSAQVVAAYEKEIKAVQAGLERVRVISAPGGMKAEALAGTGGGQLSNLKDQGKGIASLGHTIATGRGLPIIHYVTGPHITGSFLLSADDAPQAFNSVLANVGSIFPAGHPNQAILRGLSDEFALTPGAVDPGVSRLARERVATRAKAMFEDSLAKRHGGSDPDEVERARDLIREVIDKRTAESAYLHERSYKMGENGLAHMVVDEGVVVWDGQSVINYMGKPINASQGLDMVSFPDYKALDHFLTGKMKGGLGGFMARATDPLGHEHGAYALTAAGLDALNDFWKFGTLFKLGYMARTQVDSQARMLAMFGGLNYVMNVLKGSQNLIYNSGKATTREVEVAIRRANYVTHMERLDDIEKAADSAAKRLAVSTERARVQAAYDAPIPDSAFLGGKVGTRARVAEGVLASKQRATDNLAALEAREAAIPATRKRSPATLARVANRRANLQSIIDKPLDAAHTAALAEARKAASEKVTKRGTELAHYIGLGGRGSAFRNVGEVVREQSGINAQSSVLGMATSVNSTSLTRQRVSDYTQSIAGSNPGWDRAHSDFVNKHIRSDVGMTMLAAGDTEDAVRAYYRNDVKGRAVWEALAPRYFDDLHSFVAMQARQVDLALPPGSPIRDMALGGDITPTMSRQAFPVNGARPPAPSLRTISDDRKVSEQVYNRGRTWYFKWAAEIPEEMAVRHPFYVARKEAYLRQMIGNAGGDAETFTVKEYNLASKQAAVMARRDIGTHLFDTSRQSNLAYHLRFLSPFYNAWSDTVRKWGRIAGENLAMVPTVPKVLMGSSNQMVVDNDGNRIMRNGDVIEQKTGKFLRHSVDPTEGFIVFTVPEWITAWSGASADVRVSRSSLNVVFQGNPPWLPGPGPIASVPANEVMTRALPEFFPKALGKAPEWSDTMIGQFLLPYGTDASDPLYQFKPMWFKNAETAVLQNFSDDRFAQTASALMADEVQHERETGEFLTQPKLEQLIRNRTRNWYILKFFGSELPFSTQPTSRLEYYRTEWQRYQRDYGSDAREKFYDDYKEYFDASISLSVNETGITATDDAWDAALPYVKEIGGNKENGWIYAGAANLVPGFDPGVYTAQKARGWRDTKDPLVAFNDVQINKGWYDYQKVAGAIDLKLEARKANGGSASITANGNIDLLDVRDRFVAQLSAQNKPWANVYEQGGSGVAVGAFLRKAAEIARDHDELAARGDFQALEQYVQVRRILREKLDARGLKSINDWQAADIKEYRDTFLVQLVGQDIGFGQMVTRGHLDRDDLTGGW